MIHVFVFFSSSILVYHIYGKPQILHVLNRKEVQKEDSNFCSVLFSCSVFLVATSALCCRTSLMGSHPQSSCVGLGWDSCSVLWVLSGGWCWQGSSGSVLRLGKMGSVSLSVRGDQGWCCCLQQVFPSAHRGSVPEPGTRWQHWAAFEAGE